MKKFEYVGILDARAIQINFGFKENEEYILNYMNNGQTQTKTIEGTDLNETFRDLECQGCYGSLRRSLKK